MRSRRGDEFMMIFQCNLCHFRIIQHRNPVENTPDMLVLRFIRRATLDGFWSRETSTVVRNRNLLLRALQMANELNLPCPFPERGPFPLQDNVGMLQAVLQLKRTLDQGLYGEFIQFSTARRMRSVYSNFFNASVNAASDAIMAKETHKLFATTSPVYGLWYERFMEGLHERMGDDYRPDLGISIQLLHAMLKYCITAFLTSDSVEVTGSTINMGFILSMGFAAALRE